MPLLEFVKSRLPLVKYFLDHRGVLPEGMERSELRGMTKYSVAQAFFYQADPYVGQAPLASVAADEWATSRYGTGLAGLRRAKLSDLERQLDRRDRASFRRLPVIYEHIYTGGMFWRTLHDLHEQGGLDPDRVAEELRNNYRTAWVLRTENALLPQSYRGRTLSDAFRCYRKAGIQLRSADGTKFDYEDGDALPMQYGNDDDRYQREQLRVAIRSMGAELEERFGPQQLRFDMDHPNFRPSAWMPPNGRQNARPPITFWLRPHRRGIQLKAALLGSNRTTQAAAFSKLAEAVAHRVALDDARANDWQFWESCAPLHEDTEAARADAIRDLLDQLEEVFPDIERCLRDAGLLPNSRGA